MEDHGEIARQLNFFTSYLDYKDQDAVADFVADYFCPDDQVDDDDGKCIHSNIYCYNMNSILLFIEKKNCQRMFLMNHD